MNLFFFLFTLACSSYGAPSPQSPRLEFSKQGRLIALPASAHMALEPHIEIEESEQCTVKTVSAYELEIRSPCTYLGGTYVYAVREEARSKRVSTAFSVSRNATGGHVFLVALPQTLP